MAKEAIKKVVKSEAKKTEDNGRFVSHDTLVTCIKEAVGKLGPEVPKERKMEHAKMLLNIFENGISRMQALNISNKEIAPVYALAFNLFRAGKFAEAAEYYKVFLYLDPYRANFSLALASCYHRLKDYDNAIIMYMQGATLNESDPTPYFYSYDCFMNLKDPASAAVMLAGAIKRAGDEPKYQPIKQRSQMLLDDCLRTLNIRGDKAPKE